MLKFEHTFTTCGWLSCSVCKVEEGNEEYGGGGGLQWECWSHLEQRFIWAKEQSFYGYLSLIDWYLKVYKLINYTNTISNRSRAIK